MVPASYVPVTTAGVSVAAPANVAATTPVAPAASYVAAPTPVAYVPTPYTPTTAPAPAQLYQQQVPQVAPGALPAQIGQPPAAHQPQ